MREKKWSRVMAGLKGLSLLQSSTLFVFFSNLTDSLKSAFLTASESLHFTSFILKGFMFLFLTVKYALSPQKNIGRLGNWLLVTFQAVLAALVAFAGVMLGATVMTVISAVSVGVDLFINLAKSIYFLVKSETADTLEDRQLFREKGQKAALALILTGIGVMLFILISMGAPFM